ncbi:MAG: PQQ-binding-like beta-propeller repeat protein [Bryobacteraceae bacterium]|nr:PQQ-binding-like beta-propeller repeat protein [Bryobacteraceae bacterium]
MRTVLTLIIIAGSLLAEDWPEWRGRGRTGVWNETGLVERFPETGPPVSWRIPIRGGYTGPSVADGRVFVTDYADGIERALAVEERTGKILWQAEWPANYRGLDYPGGPRATPTVDGDRVYVLGAAGDLLCLRVSDGGVLWQKNYARDYGAEQTNWGTSCAPIVDGGNLIIVAGGRPDAKLIALDKLTGKQQWRALSSDSERGYSQPILTRTARGERLVVWHAGGVSLVNPRNGGVDWEHAFPIRFNTPIGTPVVANGFVLVSAFFQGARLLNLESGELIWRGMSDNEVQSDTLHAALNTPVIDGEFIYGVCAYGELRCLNLRTGKRVWETLQLTRERARYSTAFIVRNGSRYLFHTDRGDLVIGLLSRKGFEEISRANIIRPTAKPGARRELGAVNWVHPAFANGHVIVRNDEEMIRVSLRRR